MKDLRDYVNRYDVVADIEEGPDWTPTTHTGETWEHNAYKILLTNRGMNTSMLVDWTQGVLITEDPRPEAILNALILDGWNYVTASSFEDWAEDFGYSTDSRRAEAVYHRVAAQTDQFMEFLGGYEALRDLAENYERL